ncbi:MAG: DUF4230 domain-containing protein [Siphonobacter sp.]
MNTLLFLFIGFLGLGAGWGLALFFGRFRMTKEKIIRSESTVLLERIEKVFKVVLAEGHFSEIHDHTDHKEVFMGLKAGSKKALIVTKAKVLVGYDFSKVDIRWQEGTRQIIIEHMPEPEILSIDSDYTIYDIDQGLFNRFNKDEYTKLLSDAKQVVHNKAVASELPNVAAGQVKILLNQLAATSGWAIRYPLILTEQEKSLSVSERLFQ